MKKVTIPKYTLAEELINSISHGIGVLLGIIALVLTVVCSARNHNTIGIVSSCIYGSTMKKVFRVLDHCDIYLFIAGCYTPYCLSLIGGKMGWIIFSIIWISAIVGVLLNAIDLEKFQVPSTIMYLIMGWMIIFSYNSISTLLPKAGLVLLISGGIAYTIGAILYAIGSKKRYFHSVFHFFVLAGTTLQFFSILLYTI